MGKAMSETPATLLCLSHQALLELVSVHKEVRSKVYMYALVFVRELNDMEDYEVSDLRASATLQKPRRMLAAWKVPKPEISES